jgi:hypothetical protein
MAYQSGNKPVTKPAPGDAPNTGAPGPTPPPVEVERSRSFGRENYGSNAYDGRVVTDPGQRVTSPLADALEAKQHGGAEGALTLEHIRQHGTARDSTIDLASAQTRDVSKEPYPSAHGMKPRTAGPVIPSKMGSSPMADEIARRAAALKQADGK